MKKKAAWGLAGFGCVALVGVGALGPRTGPAVPETEAVVDNANKVVKSDAEWKKVLTEEQYQVTRKKGTECAFTGAYWDVKTDGVFQCVCCGQTLFDTKMKFNSGTGWPSFFQPVAKENVAEHSDETHGMIRTEILCARCDGHLGHVFDDGPRPTGLRFCVNSESLSFTPNAKLATLADPAAERAPTTGPSTRPSTRPPGA